jgi:hypothetical protein
MHKGIKINTNKKEISGETVLRGKIKGYQNQ